MANTELMEGRPPEPVIGSSSGLLDWRYMRYRFARSPLSMAVAFSPGFSS